MMSAEKAWQHSARAPTKNDTEQYLDWLKQRVQDLDAELERLIAQNNQ
jgi:hypothetical protein